ncbi:Bystin-domain-containing protein [Backusella circina FSU 941]|nr:Bystin-domain-containing protein [Backusella circina FSU 941]
MGKEVLKYIRRHNDSPFYKLLNNSKSERQQTFINRSNSMEEGIDDIDEKVSSKISKIARKQKERLQKANEDEEERNLIQKFPLGFDPDEDIEQKPHYVDFEELGIDPSDVIVFEAFLTSTYKDEKEPTDVTMDDDKNTTLNSQKATDDEYELSPTTNPKVTEVYKKIGEKLNCYISGKLPKAIKIIPSLSNWEEVLYLTEPDLWSPQALYKVTCMFVVSLNANQAQRFLSTVVLARVRQDITANNALCHYLYLSLKKALDKPTAFVKGILLPLCESGTCTLSEAAIIGSVLVKSTLPTLHSSTALSRLAEMKYTGSNSMFIRLLLAKRQVLPFKIVNTLVLHFTRFKDEPREMPFLWYQSMLTFVQLYKQDLILEQKKELLKVIKFKYHNAISPKIGQELDSADNDVSMME